MILITYNQSNAARSHWDIKKLSNAGITFITMSDLLDKTEIERDKLYLCPVVTLVDEWHDLKINRHLLEHPRVLVHLNNEADIQTAKDHNVPYVLVSPKAEDRTTWRLACGYDALPDAQRNAWDGEWDLFTQTLLKNRLLSSVVFLKNETTTLDECAPLLRGFM